MPVHAGFDDITFVLAHGGQATPDAPVFVALAARRPADGPQGIRISMRRSWTDRTGAVQLDCLFIQGFPFGSAPCAENVGWEETSERQRHDRGHCRKVQTGRHSPHLPTSHVENQLWGSDGTKQKGPFCPNTAPGRNPIELPRGVRISFASPHSNGPGRGFCGFGRDLSPGIRSQLTIYVSVSCPLWESRLAHVRVPGTKCLLLLMLLLIPFAGCIAGQGDRCAKSEDCGSGLVCFAPTEAQGSIIDALSYANLEPYLDAYTCVTPEGLADAAQANLNRDCRASEDCKKFDYCTAKIELGRDVCLIASDADCRVMSRPHAAFGDGDQVAPGLLQSLFAPTKKRRSRRASQEPSSGPATVGKGGKRCR